MAQARRTVMVILGLLLTVSSFVAPILAQPAERAIPQQVQIDWLAVARDVQALSPQLSTDPKDKAFTKRLQSSVAKRIDSYALKDGMLPLARLNELVVDLIPGVATAPMPVLAPFETGKFLQKALPMGDGRRRQQSEHRRFLYGSGGTLQLVPGTTGYDALVTYEPDALKALGIASTRRRLVHVAGATLSYGSAEAGELVEALQAQYPGLRRQQSENEVAYTFRKYGAPYFAIVSCSNQLLDPYAFKCEQAEALLRVAVQNLRLVGGNPLPVRARASTVTPPPPIQVSPDFKYYPPGKLLEGTGDDGMEGSTDRNVYGDIQFPIKVPPNYANPQVFMHWGNCLSSPNTSDKIVPLPRQPGDQHDRYRCKQNQKQLLHWEGHPENYAYPWRNNFCEARARLGQRSNAQPGVDTGPGYPG